MVHFALAIAKVLFGTRSCWPNGRLSHFCDHSGPVHFRQYRGHSLFWNMAIQNVVFGGTTFLQSCDLVLLRDRSGQAIAFSALGLRLSSSGGDAAIPGHVLLKHRFWICMFLGKVNRVFQAGALKQGKPRTITPLPNPSATPPLPFPNPPPASPCAYARHTDDTHAFPQTTLFAVSKIKSARKIHSRTLDFWLPFCCFHEESQQAFAALDILSLPPPLANWVRQVSQFFCDWDCDCLTQVIIWASNFKVSSAPRKPCDSSSPRKSIATAVFQRHVEERSVPTSFWLPTENRGVLHRGKKSIHHHRGTPLFSVCRPTPSSQSKRSYGVYHFPGKTREKGIHHRSGKKGIHHRAPDPEKEKKEGFHGGGVYFFLPCCNCDFWCSQFVNRLSQNDLQGSLFPGVSPSLPPVMAPCRCGAMWWCVT